MHCPHGLFSKHGFPSDIILEVRLPQIKIKFKQNIQLIKGMCLQSFQLRSSRVLKTIANNGLQIFNLRVLLIKIK